METRLVPVNLHESMWGRDDDRATLWSRDLDAQRRADWARTAVTYARALGFEISSGEESDVKLAIPSPPAVVDSEGRRGWVLFLVEDQHMPAAIEWHEPEPNDSRNVWITSLCGTVLSEKHNYLPPQG